MDALDQLGRDYDRIIREWKEIPRDLGADIVVLENQSLFDSRTFRSKGDTGKLMEDQFLNRSSLLFLCLNQYIIFAKGNQQRLYDEPDLASNEANSLLQAQYCSIQTPKLLAVDANR